MNVADVTDRFDRRLTQAENALAVFAGVCTIALMVVTAADAIGRYFLNAPIAVKYELTEILLMPAVVALTLSWVYRRRGHVALTMLYDLSPWVVRVGLALIHTLAVLGFCILITWYSFRKVQSAYLENLVYVGEFDWTLWMCWSVVPIGLGVLCLRVLVDLVRLCGGAAGKVIVEPNFGK